MRFPSIAMRLVCSVAMAGWALPVSAQMTPLARLSCNSATYPDCGGWRPINTNAYFSRRLVGGAGPQGQDAVEFTQTPSTSHAQYYLGWSGPTLTNPPQGVTRYLRLRFKPISPINLSGVADIWTDKFIIVADGDNPTGRVICHLSDNGVTSDNLAIFCSRNIDGYPNATPRIGLTSNAWNQLQFEFKSSSTTSRADGSLKIWKDQNNYSSPSSQSGAFQLDSTRWGSVSVGYYANASLSTNGRLVFQIADVEWDDEFDPAWSSGSVSGPAPRPSAPSGLRIIRASVGMAPVSALLAMLIYRRRQDRTGPDL